MLIDSYMSNFDAVERHRVAISAPPTDVYTALERIDLRSLPAVRLLLGLRALPSLLLEPSSRERLGMPMRIGDLTRYGFVSLAEDPPDEVVLGVTGRFWRPIGNIVSSRPEQYRDPVARGYTRAVWNFAVAPTREGSVLSTETRIACGGASARIKFRCYWALVRPFSGLIRHSILRAVQAECSRPATTGAPTRRT